MLVNKYVHLAMSLAIVIVGTLLAFDWTSALGAKSAGEIVMGLGLAKALLNTLAPAPGSVVFNSK